MSDQKKTARFEAYVGEPLEHAVMRLVHRQIEEPDVRYLMEFNGSDVDGSELVTAILDHVYQQRFGKSYSEVIRERQNAIDARKAREQRWQDELPKTTEKYIAKGHDVIDKKYWDTWDKMVPIRLSDLYHGLDLDNAIEIVSALNDGKAFGDVDAIMEAQGHSGASYGIVISMVYDLCDRGQDYFYHARNRVYGITNE